MEQKTFTINELFPDKTVQEKCHIGRKVIKTFRTFNANKNPKRVQEKQDGYFITVFQYPVELGLFDFRDYIKTQYS